ncbi:10004_t:CDS:2, partial [Acaulospora colombiana]
WYLAEFGVEKGYFLLVDRMPDHLSDEYSILELITCCLGQLSSQQ